MSRSGRVNASEAFTKAGGAETGDGFGRVAVTAGETVGLGSHGWRKSISKSMLEWKGRKGRGTVGDRKDSAEREKERE